MPIQLLAASLPAGHDGAAASALGRHLLSELCAQSGLDCPPERWSPPGQAPRHPDLPEQMHAGISHSHGRVIAGLGDQAFGLDLEYHHPRRLKRLPGMIELLPEAAIRQQIQQDSDPVTAFYRFWTLREALFKLDNACYSDLFAFDLDKALADPILVTRVWQQQDWSYALAKRKTEKSGSGLAFCLNKAKCKT